MLQELIQVGYLQEKVCLVGGVAISAVIVGLDHNVFHFD